MAISVPSVTVELPDPDRDIDRSSSPTSVWVRVVGLGLPLQQPRPFRQRPNAVASAPAARIRRVRVATRQAGSQAASLPLPFGGFKPPFRRSPGTDWPADGRIRLLRPERRWPATGETVPQFRLCPCNPLLDAGGGRRNHNGFQPGFVAATHQYFGEPALAPVLGVFGAGERGANYQRNWPRPGDRAGRAAGVRLFGGWPEAIAFMPGIAPRLPTLQAIGKARAFGFSLDPSRSGTASASSSRYGKLVSSGLPFDQGLALGAAQQQLLETRGGDTLGLAGSWLKASATRYYRALPAAVDAWELMTPTTAWEPLASLPPGPKGCRNLLSLPVSPQFDLTPDFQWVARPRSQSRCPLGTRTRPASQSRFLTPRPCLRYFSLLLTSGHLDVGLRRRNGSRLAHRSSADQGR